MPVRVRCRCGQELVLRYGEWVYVFLGVVLLCLVVNTLGLVLLYFRLDAHVPRRGDTPSAVEVEPKPGAAKTAGVRAGDSAQPGRLVDSPVATESATLPPSSEPKARSGMERSPKPRPAPAAPREPKSSRKKRSAKRSGSDRTAPDVTTADSVLAILSSAETAPSKSKLQPDAPSSHGAGAGTPQALSKSLSWCSVLPDTPILCRLHALERLSPESRVAVGFLLDPDPLLRRRAAQSLVNAPDSLARHLRDNELAGLWRAVRTRSSTHPTFWMAELERRFPVALRQGAPPAADEVRRLLDSLADEARRKTVTAPFSRSLLDALKRYAVGGVDVALVVDVSASMERSLTMLQREAQWFLPALHWALPGLRVGVVFYRDEVVSARDLGAGEPDEWVASLRNVKTAGGGDVPEAVERALNDALSLGVLRWREEAVKHIVIFGDAPPRYDALRSFETIAYQAHRQAGFRIHALSLYPQDGWDRVGAALRRAGGRAVTTTPEHLCAELSRTLLPNRAGSVLVDLLPVLRALFSQS